MEVRFIEREYEENKNHNSVHGTYVCQLNTPSTYDLICDRPNIFCQSWVWKPHSS